MMMRTYISFDLETTGLSPDTDEMIEVGAIKIVNGVPTEQFSCFVNPHREITPFITELTGITQDMVNQGFEKRPVVEEFIKFCDGYDVIGHNLMFDYKFMKNAAIALGCSFEKNGVDTLAVAKQALTQLPQKKLGNLCSYYEYTNANAHRAVHDARATAYVYEQMLKQFGKDQPELFEPKPLSYCPKKVEPMTNRQKQYLMDLRKYHKIESRLDLEGMTKSEASKLIDSLILQYGMMKRSGI